MTGKLAKTTAILMVIATILMCVAPTAVLARPPRPDVAEPPDAQIEVAPRGGVAIEQVRAPKAPQGKGRKDPDIPNPWAAARLKGNEERLVTSGISPRAAGLGLQGEAKLLVIPVEFTGTQDLVAYLDPEDCTLTETVTIAGPLHNQIPDPAAAGDNFTVWAPDFGQDFYQQLFFGEGPTAGVGVIRSDLNGGAGVDLTGMTATNYYLEQSRGRYHLTGTVLPWVQLPVSEGEYGANNCAGNDYQPWRVVRDALAAVKQRGDFHGWGDLDADHDGVIDHLMVIHAGVGEEAGGGAQGTFAIWAHSSSIPGGGYVVDDRGTADPSDDIRVRNYTIVPENTDLGVIVHEYGHDIGLPDLYSSDGYTSNSTGFWDLMSSGSWNGPLGGTQPASLSLWDRVMLGWADPVVMDVNSAEAGIKIGQLAGAKAAGTADGVIVRLPAQLDRLETAASPTHMWWSNNDKNMGDARLWRAFDLTGVAAPVTLTMKADYGVEEDWDFAAVEVSDDGGATWTQLPDANGHTTPDDYGDPNGNLARFGLRYGITGDSAGWVTLAFRLDGYAGKSIRLRLRYITDEATVERGFWADDLALKGAAGTLWSDDVEGGANGWTKDDATLDGSAPGAGWILTEGVFTFPHYYLLEWRNDQGFDAGLRYAYQHYFSGPGGDRVSRTPYTVPGVLLWYRNFRYNSNMNMYPYRYDPPSWGPKGFLLVVDSHPDPVRFPETGPDNLMGGKILGGRGQAANAVFGLNPTTGYDLTTSEWWYNYMYGDGTMTEPGKLFTGRVPSEPPVSEFHDTIGYYPGLYVSGGRNYFVDWDASVVIPAKGLYWPKWPPYPTAGNPGLNGYGVSFSVLEQAPDGTWGKVRIYNDGDTFIGRKLVDRPQARKGETVTISVILKDSAGSRYADDALYTYDVLLADAIPAGCSVVPGSITGGAEFVRDNSHSGEMDTGQVIWRGTLGGKPLSEPDAVITYQVRVDADTPVGRAMVSNGLLSVTGAGPTGHRPHENSYTLSATITVAPTAVRLPLVVRMR